MSEENNLDSTNLSIPVDAFEQFQAKSMYEEEEFITLSDIVSPDPTSQEQLPREIPFDNEVVLSANDDPDSESLPGTTKTEEANSENVSVSEYCLPVEQAVEQTAEQTLEQNIPGRPKRVRKKKSYVDDFVTDSYENDDIQSKYNDNNKKDALSSTTVTKSKRGRKPKQNTAQNENSQPEESPQNHSVEQTSKPARRGRKKASEISASKNSATNIQETPNNEFSVVMSQDSASEMPEYITPPLCKQGTRRRKTLKTENQDSSVETVDTVKYSTRKRRNTKKYLVEEGSSIIEQQGNDENNLSGELIGDSGSLDTITKPSSSKKNAGRRGRPKKTPIEPQLETYETAQQPNNSVIEDTNSTATIHKKVVKCGRKKKIIKEEIIESNDNVVSDADDELDNMSLKTLSRINEDSAVKPFVVDITAAPNITFENPQPSESDDIDVGDDMVLGQIKENLDMANTEVQDMELDETVDTINNSDINISADNESNNIDNYIKQEIKEIKTEETEEIENGSLLLEDDSKRPTRRRARKVMHYDEGSDEDPFANVELSDEEGGGKKGRYYSDDEYIPGSESKKGNRARKSITSDDDSEISEIDEELEDYHKGKRKRPLNKSSWSKKSKKDIQEATDVNVTTIVPKVSDEVEDIEVCLQSSVIQANDSATKKPTSVYTDEFENFIAQKIQGTSIKIKKVSSEQSSQSAPLEIPILDPDANKTVDQSVQTNKIKTTSSGVQTNIQHEISMKDNVPLTTEQSEKACVFLKSIVKTTSELGQLMTEKSEDFITKKINTKNVTDTFKMDYCVKKSFLLLKLAKHNIMQMEDDLAKQYEEFLKESNLISHRQEEKTIKPTEKGSNSDSDCEIVEEPVTATPSKKDKPKFNPKTVFLNKELSIKIAKKPASKAVADKCKNTLNIKNKNSVWISDTVMVKKVKPTQSFLAQDSRNKKPPDHFITEKMVSDFFDSYYQKLAPSICAPFTSTAWLKVGRNYVCNYFVLESEKNSDASISFPSGSDINVENNKNDPTANKRDIDNTKFVKNMHESANPASLISLCIAVLKKQMNLLDCYTLKKNDHQISFKESDLDQLQSPYTLFRLCLNIISGSNLSSSNNISLNHKCSDAEENEVLHDFESEKVLSDHVENVPDLDLSRVNTDVEKNKPLLEIEPRNIFADIEHNEEWHGVDPRKIPPDDIVTKAKPGDKEAIMLTLKTLCFRRIKNICFMPIETVENPMDTDDSISEVSFVLSETSSFDLSVSNYKIDEMLAELDSVFKNDVQSLFSLCVQKIQLNQKIHIKNVMDLQEDACNAKQDYPVENINKNIVNIEVMPDSLKHLSFVSIKNMMYKNLEHHDNICENKTANIINSEIKVSKYKVKKLADICFEAISAYITDNSEDADQSEKMTVGMTINCVNTVSEEAFHNMEEENFNDGDGEDFYDEGNYDGEFNNFEDQEEDNNWESQVLLQEFKPCLESNKQSGASRVTEAETIAAESNNPLEDESALARIKLEPLDEPTEAVIDSTFVKTEPMHHNEMTIIPESVITKHEPTEDASNDNNVERVSLQRQNSSSFDVDTFEDFVQHNKMMHALDELNDEVLAHHGPRVKRQHKPDYMNEYDPSLNLLVPQTFEPLSVENAKGVLMASSSDDERSNQRTSTKKKTDKKGKGRPKKGETKQQNKDTISTKQNQDLANLKQNKEPVNSKSSKESSATKGKVPPPPPVNEVAILTRRMREKIRQEEKKFESSDSESDNVPVTRKKEKDRKENDKTKSLKPSNEKPVQDETKKIESTDAESDNVPVTRKKDKDRKENDKTKSLKPSNEKPVQDEIQCSNVDSTEQIEQNDDIDKNFTGFSAVDQNEITSYQKYVKFVYDKILPKHDESVSNDQDASQSEKKTQNLPECTSNEIDDDGWSGSPLINYDEPAEMLECEPTMPIFEDTVKDVKQRKRATPKSKAVNTKEAVKAQENLREMETFKGKDQKTVTSHEPGYTEHNGWHCYSINPNETKLYQTSAIILEKLPESFVQTYFEYQEMAYTLNEDKEVDRLINLNTLNRSSMKEVPKLKGKSRVTKDGHLGKSTDTSRAKTPTSDNCAELTASEDEGANVDDEIPPPVPSKHTNENCLAKNSLMNESDSDETLKVKEEPKDDTQSEVPKTQSKKRSKDKATKEIQHPLKTENPESLMLTADKMMNKELNLLHAPVVLNNDVSTKADKESPHKSRPRRGAKGHSSRDHIKNDEDSSSEEEKQWVSTKEKLLKRMGKKQDTTSADDAKRAKLVTEFIERRGVAPQSRKRGGRGRRRRSSRKMLEREKQMRVLSHELFGTPADPALMGTRHAQFSQSYFKGRRNIRKVIDKKSLARSTVIANMEEFERKCRLNQRQAQLRELLGCEEGVNVVVINEEVCLEYGFEEGCPLVSVHPFFTKVMKAHQYEGVKFMWDACFESLEKVESGHPGGGCILAHCMGLGKTLQVLALLHTVLTHPRVGMQRILVCCPLSTVLNWVDEIHKWIGPVTDQIKVFELSKLKKTYERAYQLEDWYSGGGIFIIGYELFRSLTTLDPELDDIRPTIVNKIRTALLDPGPDIVVCDEGHLLKNDCSVLAVAMSRVATKRRIVLTGTPMQNNLREYYCMVNFVKPNLLGTYSEYSNRFENPIMNGQHRDSLEEDIKLMKQRTHILHKVLEGCLQRQEASVLYPYLPKKHEYTVFISLTKVQWDLYKHYINHYSTTNTKHSILKAFHILQKIWSHPQVLHHFYTKKRDEATKIKPEKLEDDLAHEDLTSEVLKSEDVKPSDVWWLQYLDGGNMLDSLECSNKFVVVFKILDECIALGDKVLIFSTSLFTMDALEYFLKNINKWSLGQEYYRLDGSVPAEVRQKWCREFNAEHNLKTKLFLISTRAGSLGLNMVAANRVIILDTSWNPAHDIQSIFRVYRFGQKKDCYIYRLVALGTMEQKIYERSVTKQAVSCRVVDEQQIDRHYNMAELTELYRYDEQGQSVPAGVAVGVTDVALLRVARHPALHAVHEHDSLLRGNSEQQLPEHERNAAWMQFQQEHATKQMQNQLTSSFSLHLPPLLAPPAAAPHLQTYQQLVDNVGPPPEIKTEPNLLVPYRPSPDLRAPKKNTRKYKNQLATEPQEQPLTKEAEAIQENMAGKIMNILIRHNFQNRRGPGEIAELVSTVRKIIAYGHVPKGSFDDKVAQQIADVLLMKEPTATATQQEIPKGKRGRPRKQFHPEEPSTSRPPVPEPEPQPQPSTSQSNFNVYTPGRRRAAIKAKKQFDILKDSIAGLDENDNAGDRGDDDWQNDSGPEEIVPESRAQKKAATTAPFTIKTEKDQASQLKEDICILLSDDDEPTPVKQTKKDVTKKPVQIKSEVKNTNITNTAATSEPEEVIPLHPSLLSNKNFAKIVAHTYLEGNPNMDEDAAMLAAQYSTLKAKNESEATGKPIVSGPIYDIAVRVLGINILRKLHLANPKAVVESKEAEAPQPTKEPPPQPPQVKTEPVETKKPGPRLKAKGIQELTGKSSPTPTPTPKPVPAPTAPTVVPVGFINRAGMTPNTSAVGPIGPVVGPMEQFAPAAREESILPDDDDDVSDQIPKNIFKKTAKPLILNSVIASSKISALGPTPTPSAPAPNPSQPRIPKLIISAGKLLPAKGFSTTRPPRILRPRDPTPVTAAKPPPAPQAPVDQSATICLDSDEEVITNEPAPKPKKRVATKSTAKPPAASAPVPVSITAANPQLDAQFHRQQRPTGPSHLETLLQRQQAPFTNQPYAPPQIPQAQVSGGTITINATQPPANPVSAGGQYFMSPAPQVHSLTRLPPGVAPPPGASQSLLRPMSSNVASEHAYSPLLPNSAPQHYAPVPQHYAPAPQHYAPAPQHYAPAPPQPAATESILPTTRTPVPQIPNKTVCKPGDILRITKTGQIEVLNRSGDDDVSIVDDVDVAPPPAPPSDDRAKAPEPMRTRGRAPAASKVPATATPPKTYQPTKTPQPPKPTLPENATQPLEKPVKTYGRTRNVSVSSSSSSDGSRPSTPDPLSILKDVVHIKAPEEDRPKISRPANKTSMVGSTSITKSHSRITRSLKTNTKEPSKTPTSKPSTPAKSVTQDDIMKHISQTDTILKKLDKALAPGKSQATPQKTSTAANKTKPSGSPQFDTIDLDTYVKPTKPAATKPTAQAAGSSRQAANTKSTVTTTQTKPTPPAKPAPKKIVGTSAKDIIISMSGKSPTLTTTASANKSTARITSVEKIAPANSVGKKRPAAADTGPQKKKPAQMSLKDFNIDDIDDIIELD